MTVILVSSDIDLQAILTDRLLRHGYTILTANDAEPAEQFASLPEVSAVLLDRDGSVVDTRTFLRWLQQHRPRVPVIALSIRVQLDEAALRDGASQYLRKPLDLAMLIMALSQRDLKSDVERRRVEKSG